MTRTGRVRRVRDFFSKLGPGLITGAADDDPSGISTYSVSGAAYGYILLWTALFSFPLMAAVQLMCARLGIVTRRGLAANVRRNYPRWVLWMASTLLLVANLVNIGADLGGMAEASELVTGIPSPFWTPLYALLIVSLLFWSSYRQIVRIFKCLTLILFSYVAAAFLSRPDWYAVLGATLIPRAVWSGDYLAIFVGILGTTISPYLFFWQAAQEVEEERGRPHLKGQQKGATAVELKNARSDVITGMLFSNLVMYFIILTAAAALHTHGRTAITTARQAAEVLRPLAGDYAYWLFTTGLIGTGMLGVPVLAGSSAYAAAEAWAWRGSLTRRPRLAPRFYAVIAASVALGLVLDFTGFDAVALLFWSAVLNGILAPPLVLLVVLLTNNPAVMGEHVNGPVLRWLGIATFAIMGAAAITLITLAF